MATAEQILSVTEAENRLGIPSGVYTPDLEGYRDTAIRYVQSICGRKLLDTEQVYWTCLTARGVWVQPVEDFAGANAANATELKGHIVIEYVASDDKGLHSLVPQNSFAATNWQAQYDEGYLLVQPNADKVWPVSKDNLFRFTIDVGVDVTLGENEWFSDVVYAYVQSLFSGADMSKMEPRIRQRILTLNPPKAAV